MHPPLVSVIIPTYNRPEFLQKCLESVLVQSYRHLEIIVINDGGSDLSDVIHAISNAPRIEYLVHATNRGMAAARNTGLRTAKGTYVAYLDDDDLYYPQHVERLVNVLEQGRFAVAYSDACRAHMKMSAGRYEVVERDVPYSVEFDADRLLLGNFTPTLCVMHRRDCLTKTGLFDETLDVYEDWDLWIRMAQQFPFYHLKDVTCEFSWREDGSSTTSSRQSEFILARPRIYSKYSGYASEKPVIAAEYQAMREGAQSEVYLWFHQFLKEKLEQFRTPPLACDSVSDLTAKVFPSAASVTDAQERLLTAFSELLGDAGEAKKALLKNRTTIERLTAYQNRVMNHPLYKAYRIVKRIVRPNLERS